MVPKTKSFNSAHSCPLIGEENSAAPLNSSAIAEKVLGTATGEISFSPEEALSINGNFGNDLILFAAREYAWAEILP